MASPRLSFAKNLNKNSTSFNIAHQMDYATYEERLSYLLEMAEKGRLFSLKQASHKMGNSTRTIKRMLVHLRAKGHNIRYSRALRRFVVKK